VSFAYNDSLAVKIFSIVNMCLHITCAFIALIKWKRIGNVIGVDDDNGIWMSTIIFLILFPVFVIPIFWITYLVTNHMVASTNLLFIILFGTLLAFTLMFLILVCCKGWKRIPDTILVIFLVICFYTPNILQTLLILLMWPINFYFVKTCVFVLVLSLTRNISYFTDEVPNEFLATSTAAIQWKIRDLIDKAARNDDKAEE